MGEKVERPVIRTDNDLLGYGYHPAYAWLVNPDYSANE